MRIEEAPREAVVDLDGGSAARELAGARRSGVERGVGLVERAADADSEPATAA